MTISYSFEYKGTEPKKMNQVMDLNKALKISTVKIWELSIQEAPRVTGQLKRSIQVDYSELPNLITKIFSSLKYAFFVHEGTRAHDIIPTKKKALKFQWMGAECFFKKVHIGAIQANPFLERAIDKGTPFIKKTFSDVVKKIK